MVRNAIPSRVGSSVRSRCWRASRTRWVIDSGARFSRSFRTRMRNCDTVVVVAAGNASRSTVALSSGSNPAVSSMSTCACRYENRPSARAESVAGSSRVSIRASPSRRWMPRSGIRNAHAASAFNARSRSADAFGG